MKTSVAQHWKAEGCGGPSLGRAGSAAAVPWAAGAMIAEFGESAPAASGSTVHVRAMFLSDLHLGTRGCQADQVLSFLRGYDAELIYLVGDIIDGWQLKTDWYWPQAHNDVVQELLRKARNGARVFYIPGNHDEFLRGFYGTHFGGIEVAETVIHQSLRGRRYLVIHGDLFDIVITQARWLALLGGKAYDLAIALNTHFNLARRFLGMPYWSLSQWVKLKVKNAVKFIGAFEDTLAAEAARQGADGVICGHIHHAVIREAAGSHYMNCGDWVESCTALVEHLDGRFAIVRGAEDLALGQMGRGQLQERTDELLSA